MAKNYRLRFKTCNLCQQKGHIESACRKKTSDQRQVQHVQGGEEAPTGSQEDFLWIESVERKQSGLFHVSSEPTDPQFFEFTINGSVKLLMKVDSGSYATVKHENIRNTFFLDVPLSAPSLNLRSVAEVELPVSVRREELQVTFQGKTRRLGCHVVAGDEISEVGRECLAAFGLWRCDSWKQITDRSQQSVYKIDADETIERLAKKISDSFRFERRTVQ